ncbi:MAG: class I SAM-dependent methyltransferase [Flavobacteriales bacterium]|nr:class I SAM-dependent methyltransferase [Flavobacteriales bacterium]
MIHPLLFRIGEYIRYRQHARGIQYIHSPFLFQLMQTCFYDSPQPIFEPIENLRLELLKNYQTIVRTDLGAGNTGINKIQTIRSIAQKSLQPPHNARLLYRLAKHMQAKNILELGTSFGITTSYLSLAADNGKVTTIEGDPAIQKLASNHFITLEKNNIFSLCGNFDDVLADILSANEAFDMVWIDGNHRKEPTLRYFEMLLPSIHPEGVLIFDDIHWSPEMADAWEIICKHKQVTLTLDIFQMGIVFISKKLSKEHRIIKYPL